MSTMNQSQLKYIRERAKTVYGERVKAVTDSFNQKEPTSKDKLQAISEGRFTVNKKVTGGDWYLTSYITFTDFPKTDVKARDKALGILAKDYQKLLDNIILGEAPEALALLEAFAKG